MIVFCFLAGGSIQGLGVARAGGDDRQGAPRVGRLRVHRPDPRRHLRRRPRIPPFPLRHQGGAGAGGGGGGRARRAAAGAGARVPRRVAEARRGGGRVGAAHRGPRRGHAQARQALRRAAAVPPVRAPRGQGLPRRRAVRRVPLRAPPRPGPGARAPAAPRGRRPADGAVGAGEGVAGGVQPARRGHGLARSHLRRRRAPLPLPLRTGRGAGRRLPGPAAADAALRDVRPQDCAGRLRAMQADAAAVPPPRLRLRPSGAGAAALPRAPLQAFQVEDADGEGGQDVAAPGEEGDEGQSDGLLGEQDGAGGRGHVMGEVQQQHRQPMGDAEPEMKAQCICTWPGSISENAEFRQNRVTVVFCSRKWKEPDTVVLEQSSLLPIIFRISRESSVDRGPGA